MILPKLWVYPAGALATAFAVLAYIYLSDRLSDSAS